jgi:hypothetical protein
MHTITGVEIFAAGTHGDRTYSHDDLDAIVRNFAELSAGETPVLQPPIVLGHDEDQALLARSDLPAAGWVKRLYREGPVLRADLGEVPDAVAALINQRAYRKVSAEIYDDFAHNDKRFGKTLRRIALLGGGIPVIKTLADIPKTRAEFQAFCEGLLAQGKLLPAMLDGGLLVDLAASLDGSAVHKFAERESTQLDALKRWLGSFPPLVRFAERIANPAAPFTDAGVIRVSEHFDRHAADFAKVGLARDRFVQAFQRSGMSAEAFVGAT